MYVTRHMSSPPATIMPDTPIAAIRDILNSNNFRHLPVVNEDGHLIGMVTDRDLRSAYPSSVLAEEDLRKCSAKVSEQPASAIMSQDLVSLSAFSTLDDALYLLDRSKVGALPVIDADKRVIGVFSIRDLIKAYKNLFGLGERGSALVAVEDDGLPKPLTRLVRTLEEHSIRFTRLIRTRTDENSNAPGIIYLRVHTFNMTAVHKALENAGFAILLPSGAG